MGSFIRAMLLLLLVGVVNAQLSVDYYSETCPDLLPTLRRILYGRMTGNTRLGPALLRLHFKDCFVNGCDASVLLDDTEDFIGEKTSDTNINSLRGFETIDFLKRQADSLCRGVVVSCADILAIAARDATVRMGGRSWDVKLGRRDSTTASLEDANRDLPRPEFSLTQLIASFANKGFDARELVALSGGHTVGRARCTTFRDRIHNDTNINLVFATTSRLTCPASGDDGNLQPLDVTTPDTFGPSYYRNLIGQMGLLHSDQELFTGGETDRFVDAYSLSPRLFESAFADAMLRMSELSPLTGDDGQIRRNCSRINAD